MKKRGLASLLVVSIIAIAAVFGVIFAFQNAGRQKDVYGSVTVTVDKPNINLEIELEKDETADKKFRIVETPLSSTYFTIKVDGLPETADRSVELNESSISSGIVNVTPITPRDEAGKTGVNTFMVTGQNGGAPITMTFTTRSGAQTIGVNVTVKMTAKDMKLAPNAHFGVRQGGTKLDLMSADVLNKFTFFAHHEDTERVFTPNNFPVEYRLKEQYPGVILQQGALSVEDDATCVDQYVYLQAKLPAMTEWIDVPFYVFPSAKNITVNTDAYKTASTPDKTWDLIANRTNFSSATFEFGLDCAKTQLSDYGFVVKSADTLIARVDYIDQYTHSLSTVKNLGQVAINITAYPIVKDGGKEIAYADSSDKNVQITDTIYLRVRNEFYLHAETEIYGTETFNLATDKESINAFHYEGDYYDGEYFDTFVLNTANGKVVNEDADVEFELIVEDRVGDKSGTYGRLATEETHGISLYNILQIGYWSAENNDWVYMSPENYYTHYQKCFSVAFMKTAYAEDFLSDDMTLTLRIKSTSELSVGGKASCDVNLDVTSVIDKFKVDNLTTFNDGTSGVALVYNIKHQEFSTEVINVYGMVANTGVNNTVDYAYSAKWNTAKVVDNSKDLPFIISPVTQYSRELDCYYIAYTITANNIDLIEYYKDYQFTIEYANGKNYTFAICVYPTVETLSMSVISNNRGKIYDTIIDNHETTYDYVRTAYVRKGYTYEFAVQTPGVNVGAYAVFDSVYDASGKKICDATNAFDARNLAEGLYECHVTLHAYSDSVYGDSETEIVVYMIVVAPIDNVIYPEKIDLDGITDSAEIALKLTTLDGKEITDNNYVNIEVVEPVNANITLQQGSGVNFNKFTVTAKYLADKAFNVGFKIYKSYNFPAEFDLDGQNWTDNVPFEFYYLGGSAVNVNVVVDNKKPNTVTVVDGVKHNNATGKYLELISETGKIVEKEISVKVANDAAYQNYGIAYAEWKYGKFELNPFTVVDGNLLIADCAVARLDTATGKIYVSAVEGKLSLGLSALVVYASDSLRYVGKDSNGTDLVLPDVYEMVALYIGTEDEVKEKTDEFESDIIHDANSGLRNTRGGYNWVLASQKPNDYYAALFYTAGEDNYGSQIAANVYYLDDLYTVLGWDILRKPETVYISKFVNGEQVGATLKCDSSKGRLNIDLNHVFNIDNHDNNNFCTRGNNTVYFELNITGRFITFYVVESIDIFELMIQSASGTGVVSRKNLSPDEFTNAVDTVTMQRGNEFSFAADLDVYSGWKLKNHNFDSPEQSRTDNVTYAGGTYSFNPYIEFTTANGAVYTFNLDALTSTVRVNVKGGINYLNIVQDSISLDGVSSATYDLTMRIDQDNWSPSLLTYNFLYDGIYYRLFENNQTTSYVNMEGGKAKLEFKLTCLNAANPVYANLYYTYYLKIEVAVVITVPDVDPFYNVAAARLYVQENLADSPLLNIKTPSVDSSILNLTKQGIYNVTMAHFADTNAVEGVRSAVSLTNGQSDAGIIYLDDESVGGILVVYPTPYYINVSSINLWTSQPHTEKVLIGTDLSGKPIYDSIVYSVGFTQMVYNEDQKFYQPYISNSTMPKMISSWSKAEGYKWTGKYYFKTSIISSSQFSHRLANGTRFGISVSIQGESNAKAITETMTIDAKYRDSFVVEPDDDVEDYAVCTMSQTQYQAVGTTAVYDVALPVDCVPNYANFTLNGVGTTSSTIESKYARITINPVAQTLSVYLKADMSSIGATLEVRIPYKRPGDYVNPYLSVVIVPVYFEVNDLEVINHYESRLQITRDELTQLKYRALFNYDTSMLNSTVTEKMNAFNNSLLSSSYLSCDYETAGQITVEVAYSYVNGEPVLTKNGNCRYARTFYYDITMGDALIKRTEYLAVGTAGTYTFYNWDPLHASRLYLQDAQTNDASIKDYWDKNIKTENRNTVTITVSLENKSATVSNNEAYKALIQAGKIVINVYSTANIITPQLELTIIPVYFTFSEFKLANNPVDPIVALTTPTVLTVEAGDIVAVDDSDVVSAINTFNAELLNAQNNLSNTLALSFSRVPNDDGVLNFNFDNTTRALTRADASNPITATSYLLVAGNISYVNGIPTLNNNGDKILTYLPVRTFGSGIGESEEFMPDLEVAPNGRTRTVAQAIGTSIRYNIALPGVIYDSLVDKYEVRQDGKYVWTKGCGWNVIFNFKESVITVDLDQNTDLFDKVLVIMAYNRDGELMYALKVIPTYFTVEQILLADHIDESPVLIQNESNWLAGLRLDFVSNYSNETASDVNFENWFNDFLYSLNGSSLVSRIDDAGYVTVFAGISYVEGLPRLVNLVNAQTVVQNAYRYELTDGIPENTKAQAIGQEVVYNVNRTVGAVKISTGKDGEGNDIWETYDNGAYQHWWLQFDSNPKRIRVGLNESTELIGQVIRMGIFIKFDDEEPSYILNIIPAYFTVDDLTVAGQTNEDRDIVLYYGDECDSPEDVLFEAVFGEYSTNEALNIPAYLSAFNDELQTTKAHLIGRYYDSSVLSGDLHITAYLNYQNGTPTLVEASLADSVYVARIDIDFTYTIYGKNSYSGDLPPMPVGPRTRSVVQAVGTTASYVIDVNKDVTLDLDYLTFDDEKLQKRGWKVTFDESILTVQLLPDAETLLKNDDIVFNFYAGYELAFVLTVQPVLFEVVGIETIYPEQPVDMTDLSVTEIFYRAKVKYNDEISYQGDKVIEFIDAFNTILNSERGNLLEVTVEDQYLKIDVAVDYGSAGSDGRRVPALLSVESYPLNVIENYIEFTVGEESSSSAKHYQAVGTTEFYYLGAEFTGEESVAVVVDGSTIHDTSIVGADVVEYGVGYALKVFVAANSDLVGKNITISISGTRNFTMNIEPVWFLVDGFEVVNHPEQHMWLIIADDLADDIDDLMFRVHARYSLLGDESFKTALQAQIDAFNQQLALYDVDTEQWTKQTWANYLDIYTIGAEYLVVRAAIDYENGVPSIIKLSQAVPTQIVRDVFEYVRYSDQINLPDLVRPNIPRSRTVDLIIGYNEVYTIDFNELPFGFTNDMIALYENSNSEYADDDTKLTPYENGSNGWKVQARGNQLYVTLDPNADLVNRELKVFIYYEKNHVQDAPNSFDVENVAFILTIRPVWFKVTGFALNGYADNMIVVDSIDDFMSDLSEFDGDTYFTPVLEYSKDVFNQTEGGVGALLQEKMKAFIDEARYSPYVTKTRTRESDVIYHFQVASSISYVPFQGIPEFSDEISKRVLNSFKVVVGSASEPVERVEYQAIGTSKTYYVDSSVLDGVTGIENGANYTVTWDSTDKNYVTVNLLDTAEIGTPIEIEIGSALVLKINPVYYEVLGFETIDHPERAVWVISPYTVEDLKYRVLTTKLSSSLTDEILANVQSSIDSLNASLNNGNAPVSIMTDSYQNIIFDAAINYEAGYPTIAEITKDQRNVVESIIPYRIWSASLTPKPERPTVMGTTKANQVLGATKLYSLKNIKGQVCYQYLWTENAGSLITPFKNSLNGTSQVYDNLSILVDPTKGTLQVQLKANISDLANNIRIYIPYMTLVNGKDVWYSHCIEITPLLFELKGWTIEAADADVGATQLIKNENNPDYLLLTSISNLVTNIKYVAKVNASKADDVDLQRAIEAAKLNIENSANEFISATVTSNNVELNNLTLRRNVDAYTKTDNIVGLSTYIVYEDGVPKLVNSSSTLIANQILISTGYTRDEWNSHVQDVILSSGVANSIQVIGTSVVHTVEITDAGKVFYDQITVVDRTTQEAISIPGERSNLVIVDCELADETTNTLILNVELAAVVALRNVNVEIKIPYAESADATEPDYVFSYYITPVLYVIDGFYLDAAENNYLELGNQDIPLELHVKASYADDVNVRNIVNLFLTDLESSLNTAIYSETISFEVEEVEDISGGVNVRLQSFGNTLWIQKIGDITASNNIVGSVVIGYNGGIPQIGSVNPLTDVTVDIQIQVNTKEGEISFFPGWDTPTLGESSEHLQSIGTSRNYPVIAGDPNITFYYEFIEIFNGGLKRGENEYEFFAFDVIEPGRQNLTLGFTLRASAKILTGWIDVRIPYTRLVDGETQWFYYSLQVKPVLFEIKGWKLKVGGELVDSVTLNDSAVELYFTPEIASGPLNEDYYSTEELLYIRNAIRRLEKEINTYDPKISDGYTYMVIQNTAQEGFQVNYSVYRENSTNTSYLLRDSAEASTTIMQLSANISYGVTNFTQEYVDGAQAVAAYGNTEGAQRITSQIAIYTTEKSTPGSDGDRSTVFITQDNASRLMELNSGIDYVLMSDIYLYKIPQLKNGMWKPADFPENTTLDGNNFKIHFNDIGFDLTDTPANIGLFTTIPTGSVVKNLQVVLEHGPADDPNTPLDESITVLNVNLEDYAANTVNVGLLAGINNGIITNCAVLSEWQFDMRNLTSIENPMTGEKFETDLAFNKDGYVFDADYFYKLSTVGDKVVVSNVYNNLGHGITKNETTGKWEVEYDQWENVKNWIVPDRTSVANYDDYSPIMNIADIEINSQSAAKLYVYAKNENLTVTLGGLVGTNTYMVTNSRVLIDVELFGPEQRTESGQIDEISVLSSVVGGLAGINQGTITTSYFRDGSVINNANADKLNGRTSLLGGFVGQNEGIIQQSYAMGRSTEREDSRNHISTAGAVRTIRNSLGGFVHINTGTITDCLVNMVIEKTGTEGSAGGFVYQNTATGKISNCIENNNIILQSSSTLDFYSPFVVINGDKQTDKVVTTNLSNLIYAGNADSISLSDDWNGTLKHLTNSSNNQNERYTEINNFEGFSIGDDSGNGVSDKNTIWKMTNVGPMLRAANEIAISYRKYTWGSSPYLYQPGTAENPYLIWTEDQFNDYVYGATAQATESDKAGQANVLTNIERSRQNNHLRLVDNVLLNGIKDTYKIIYTGTFEGNGLTMSGISLDTVTNDLATMGLFGKTEYATIRNINFEVGSINSTARYVGGIAGIAINTSFVDVKVSSADVIKGANIVGGFVGLNVVNDISVENYNLHSSVSVTANFHSGQTDIGSNKFSSGKEYYQQTLYAKVEALDISYEQGYGTAGAVFGFITSNPNNYRVVDENGVSKIYAREFYKQIVKKDAAGNEIAIAPDEDCRSLNTEREWFLKDRMGNVINDTVNDGMGVYYTSKIILQNISGAVKDVSANVAGGLIGIMDETIELRKPDLLSLNSLTGKYYLGGIVGINLGKITGGVTVNNGETTTYSTMNLKNWTTLSSAGSSYIFRDNPSVVVDETVPLDERTCFWGMTVGAIAGYNDGFNDNINSGVIENIHVDVNVLGASKSALQYVIGGVVGVNGDYGYVNNAINTNSVVNVNSVQVKAAQVQKFGFYFGSVIGYSRATGSSFSGGVTTRMNMLRINVPYFATYSYVSADDFKTSEVDNAFGVVANTTYKVQTMTLEEYKAYLANTITDKDLVTRVTMLEPWLRSLPTYVTSMVNHKNVLVRAEAYYDSGLADLLNWVKENKIFAKWDYSHSSIEGYSDKVLANYMSYVSYGATSTKAETSENENEFIEKVNEYREARYQKAVELFTYQYKVYGDLAGAQNANFTWAQYEDYLLFKEYSKDSKVASTDYRYAELYAIKGDSFTEMVFPSTETLAEYVFIKDDKGNNTQANDAIKISSQEYFRKLLANMEESRQFTSKDPMQIFINYVIETANTDENNFKVNGWQLPLAHYYYYMSELYGQNFTGSFGTVNYNYSVPSNFPVAGTNGYVSYLYLNQQLDINGSGLLTVPEFIDMISRENDIIMENETAWVKYGHRLNSADKNSTRISDIGALTLNWTTAAKLENAQEQIQVNNGVISYTDEFGTEQSWQALVEYTQAKATKGLTISKYKQIIGMGGSLYALIHEYESAGETATDSYIFALKQEQYNWSAEQSNFIKNYYTVQTGGYDLKYALAATTYGNVFSESNNGNVRAVYQTKAQIVDNNNWFVDNDGDGVYDSGEPLGVWYFPASNAKTEFKNGEDTYYIYNYTQDLHLGGHGNVGPAMYIDNGDKLFGTISAAGTGSADSRSSGLDKLILYQVDVSENPDFYQGELGTENVAYFKIARQILPNDMVFSGTENSGNVSDYLEEALWWRNEGFTAEEFDKIKTHAMTKSMTKNVNYVANSENGGFVYFNNNGILTRKEGYTLADDWSSSSGNGASGFKSADFTTAEYVEIVLGTDYDTSGENWKWWSTYADYLLFVKVYNATLSVDGEINEGKIKDEEKPMIPSTSAFRNPFSIDDMGYSTSVAFVDSLATENDLADAIEFVSDRAAFMTLFRAEHTTADYINWAYSDRGSCIIRNKETNTDETKYFRLNHYIYYVQQNLDEDNVFDSDDFKWVLTQNVRKEIFYNDVTQKARTDDLVEYRRNWYNDGQPFMTYRDYCEWINIYAYDDQYRPDRGDVEDVESGETIRTTDGWLTIDAFAVWKRMEKYENNVEYLKKIGTTTDQAPITTPILKRQISTTVFPKIQSSGEKAVDEKTGMETGDKYILPQLTESNASDDKIVQYYGWDQLEEYENYKMPLDHQRHVIDRYEYNERYEIMDAGYRGTIGEETYEFAVNERVFQYYDAFVFDNKYATKCDHACGGNNGATPQMCQNTTHAAYIVRQWLQRYLYHSDAASHDGTTWSVYSLKLDETEVITESQDTGKDSYKQFLWWTWDHKDIMVHLDRPASKYAQLYVPYDYFKRACQAIKSVYSSANGYKGYFNYMKFWAKNGAYNWICDFSEYDGVREGVEEVKYTYLETAFWNNYDGKTSPLKEDDGTPIVWYNEQKQ